MAAVRHMNPPVLIKSASVKIDKLVIEKFGQVFLKSLTKEIFEDNQT